MKIEYTVQLCDYEAAHDQAWDDLSLEEWLKLGEATISANLDERTRRTYIFNSQEEAEAAAQRIIDNRRDENGNEDKWLASIEIHKHTDELVKKIK